MDFLSIVRVALVQFGLIGNGAPIRTSKTTARRTIGLSS